MSESYFFETVDLFTVGTLGPKGQRVFYLQCRAENMLVSLKLEKQQASALGVCLARLLLEIPSDASEPPRDLDMREPVIEAWTVGDLGVAYHLQTNRIVVAAKELVSHETTEPAEAHFVLSHAQVAALVHRTVTVLAAGRPPCPFCGRPLETANRGWCPCHN